jgi:hypothetical protein
MIPESVHLLVLGIPHAGNMAVSTDHQERNDTMATLTNTDLNHEELALLLNSLEDKQAADQIKIDMDDEAYLEGETEEEIKERLKMLSELIHKVDRLYLQ